MLKNSVLWFDFIGSTQTLTVKGAAHARSFIGVILSATVFLLTLVVSKQTIEDWNYRTNPTLVRENNLVGTDILGFRNDSAFYLTFYMIMGREKKVVPIPVKSLINLPFISQYTQVGPVGNGTVETIEMIRCSKDYIIDFFKYNEKSANLSDILIEENGLCIQSKKLLMQKGLFKNIIPSIYLNGPPVDCASYPGCLDPANKIAMIIYAPTFEVNPNLYNIPYNKVFNRYYYQIEDTKSKVYELAFSYKKIKRNAKRSVFFDDLLTYSSLVAVDSQLKLNYDINSLTRPYFPYLMIELSSSQFSEILTLNYLTIQDVISSLGGSLSMVFPFVKMFGSFLCSFHLRMDFLNSLFSFFVIDHNQFIPNATQRISMKDGKVDEIHEKLFKIKRSRVERPISQLQLIKLDWKKLIKRKLNSEERNIEASEYLWNHCFESSILPKMFMDIYLIKHVLFQNHHPLVFNMPVDLNSVHTHKYLTAVIDSNKEEIDTANLAEFCEMLQTKENSDSLVYQLLMRLN